MSFISPSEFNILMDSPDIGEIPTLPQFTSKAMHVDDLKRFRDCGVQTVLQFLHWDRIETKMGVRDWALGDEIVTRCRAAGLKVLLMLPTTTLTCAPDEWYVWDEFGHVYRKPIYQGARQTWGCLSPWNPEARAYLLDFVLECCNRYNTYDVMCINAQSQEGEALMPPGTPCIYDPMAVASFKRYAGKDAEPNINNPQCSRWLRETLTDLLIDELRIYHPSGGDVFTSMHPIYTDVLWKASGNMDITCYLDAIRAELMPTTHYHIVFAWFGKHGFERFRPWMEREQAKGVQFITGSEWPEGLAENTPKAIAQDIRALLTAPCHPYLHRTRAEEWMYEAFKDSRRQFARAAMVQTYA
jgi:hypothetical protein